MVALDRRYGALSSGYMKITNPLSDEVITDGVEGRAQRVQSRKLTTFLKTSLDALRRVRKCPLVCDFVHLPSGASPSVDRYGSWRGAVDEEGGLSLRGVG